MMHENDEPSSNPAYRKVFDRELKAWSRGRVHRRDEALGSRFCEHVITMMVEKAGPSRMGLQLFAVTLTLPSEKQESLKECARAFLRASDPNTPSWAIRDDEGGWLVLDLGSKNATPHLHGFVLTREPEDRIRDEWIRAAGGRILKVDRHPAIWSDLSGRAAGSVARWILYSIKHPPGHRHMRLHARIVVSGFFGIAWSCVCSGTSPSEAASWPVNLLPQRLCAGCLLPLYHPNPRKLHHADACKQASHRQGPYPVAIEEPVLAKPADAFDFRDAEAFDEHFLASAEEVERDAIHDAYCEKLDELHAEYSDLLYDERLTYEERDDVIQWIVDEAATWLVARDDSERDLRRTGERETDAPQAVTQLSLPWRESRRRKRSSKSSERPRSG